jgi:hypothetical protein
LVEIILNEQCAVSRKERPIFREATVNTDDPVELVAELEKRWDELGFVSLLPGTETLDSVIDEGLIHRIRDDCKAALDHVQRVLSNEWIIEASRFLQKSWLIEESLLFLDRGFGL